MSLYEGALRVYLLNKHTKEFTVTFTPLTILLTDIIPRVLKPEYKKKYLGQDKVYIEESSDNAPGPYGDEYMPMPPEVKTLVLIQETEDYVIFKALTALSAVYYDTPYFYFKDERYARVKGWIMI